MDQNMIQVSTAKKVWHIMRIAFYMLKKGICKKKMLLELNTMMKRGKLAGKALTNLMFNHNTTTTTRADGHHDPTRIQYAPGEYEFSCKSTPLYRQYFNKRKNHHQKMPSYLSNYSYIEDNENVYNLESVNKVLEMMVSNHDDVWASPALGFGPSPAVRQLRITDSPFPVQNMESDCHVDMAAEEFIRKFYSQLK